jgi:hypothetical protein
MRLLSDLSEKFPTTIKFQNSLVVTAFGVMHMELRRADFAAAEDARLRAAAVLEALHQQGLADNPVFQSGRTTLQTLATVIPLIPKSLDSEDFATAQPPDVAAELLSQRAWLLAMRGDDDGAVAAADRAKPLASQDHLAGAYQLARIAGAYAVVSERQRQDAGADPGHLEQSERIAALAVTTLQEVAARSAAFAPALINHPEFNFLRDRRDFREAFSPESATAPAR